MQVKPEQLTSQLERGLAPVYLLAGDEPLQHQEAADAIRAAARAAGHGEREVLAVETGFDWGRLAAAGANLSLFGDRRLLELRLPTGKPGQEGGRTLAQWCGQPPADTVLMILSGRLEPAQRKAAWFRAVDRVGVVVQVWSLGPAALPRWIAGRLQAAGLQASGGAVELLAERSEGNLLAAVQEIEKLRLLHGESAVDEAAVAAAVADSARHDVFDLATAAFSGDGGRVVRVGRSLAREGAEPTLALWALSGGSRAAARIRAGTAARDALRANRVFGDLARAVERAVPRRSARGWEAVLLRCARLDRVIKGAAPGRPWDELLNLGLMISGASKTV